MKTSFKYITLSFFWVILFLIPTTVEAHEPDQSYVILRVYNDSITGRIEMTTEDVDRILDLNAQKELTLDDIKIYLPRIHDHILEKVGFDLDGKPLSMEFTEPTMFPIEGLGNYAQMNFKLKGFTEIPDAINVRYEILLDEDINHRGLMIMEYNWKAGIYKEGDMIPIVFSRLERNHELSLTDASVLKGFISMIKMGVWHIWIGIDHILFLLALILPAVVRRIKNEDELTVEETDSKSGFLGNLFSSQINVWKPVERFRPAFIYIVKIVTLFTVAHTITLSLASLQIVNLPSRFVESVIALSIALAAYHNIRPIFKSSDWVIAFGFGLFHGFGFASVLGDIGLQGEFLTLSLLGFNLGVELGQVVIILLIFPILYFLRKSSIYPKIIFYGSILLIFISMYWFIERAFDIDLHLGRIVIGIYKKLVSYILII